MNNIINNNYKSELIVINAKEDTGATSLLLKIAKDSIMLSKKVLLISLSNNKDIMYKRVGIEDTNNLVIVDSSIQSLNEVKALIDTYKPQIVLIEYLQCVQDYEKDITILKDICLDNNIPIVATEIDVKDTSIIEVVDQYSTIEHIKDKEYLFKTIKDNYGELKETDLRELLND